MIQQVNSALCLSIILFKITLPGKQVFNLKGKLYLHPWKIRNYRLLNYLQFLTLLIFGTSYKVKLPTRDNFSHNNPFQDLTIYSVHIYDFIWSSQQSCKAGLTRISINFILYVRMLRSQKLHDLLMVILQVGFSQILNPKLVTPGLSQCY